MPQDQRSVTDQLRSLIVLANKAGLYDAADWVNARLQPEFRVRSGELLSDLSLDDIRNLADRPTHSIVKYEVTDSNRTTMYTAVVTPDVTPEQAFRRAKDFWTGAPGGVRMFRVTTTRVTELTGEDVATDAYL